MRRATNWLVLAACLAATPAGAQSIDVAPLFAQAEQAGRVGLARKTQLVDARPAALGEIVVTVIAGEGKETQSTPAELGDMVVRNRCPATGNEQYLVKARNFAARYDIAPGEPDPQGWRPYRPRGIDMRYFVVDLAQGSFTFTAPWGEAMVARPGDAIVRNPADARDTYRIAAAAFTCTYEIVKTP